MAQHVSLANLEIAYSCSKVYRPLTLRDIEDIADITAMTSLGEYSSYFSFMDFVLPLLCVSYLDTNTTSNLAGNPDLL